MVAFRALYLGDLLCAIPALRAMRRSAEDVRLTLMGLPWAASLVGRYPAYLDDFIEFPGWPGIPEREPDPERAREFERQARQRRFDLAVQMHGDGGIANGFLATIPAAARTGFAPAGKVAPGYLEYPQDCSEVVRLLRLAAHVSGLDVEDLDASLEFPVFEAERAAARALLVSHGVDVGTSYVCVHAGGRGDDRRWPAAAFAAVADVLGEAGLPVVLTGTEADRAVNAEVRARARTSVIDITGKTAIGELAAVIEGAQLIVTNDSGPSHLAAALRVPSVVVFTGSDRLRWAPADGQLHVAVGAGRPEGSQVVSTMPTVEEVLAALPARLANRGVAA